MLDEAKRLSGDQLFIVRWITGVVFAQLPNRFGRRETAQADLNWCLENEDKSPGDGWTREVYYQLGKLNYR
jgi:hypothetical protein